MSENEFGQTVFNYPSLGLNLFGEQGQSPFGEQTIGPTPERLGTEITAQQVFSNPLAQFAGGEPGALRSIYAPGSTSP